LRELLAEGDVLGALGIAALGALGAGWAMAGAGLATGAGATLVDRLLVSVPLPAAQPSDATRTKLAAIRSPDIECSPFGAAVRRHLRRTGSARGLSNVRATNARARVVLVSHSP